MSLTPQDLLHILATMSALLVAAHLGGFVAVKLKIPPMVGELCGGVLLGATVLRRVWPAGHAWLLPAAPDSPVNAIIGFCSTIGLLSLLFIGGIELRRMLTRRDLLAVGWISSLGVLVPVGAGLVLLQWVDVSRFLGPAQNLTALRIVLLVALAITSIPVITRIFLDLGLIGTRLARVTLSVAVIEDVLLYIALSIALGMANAEPSEGWSVPHLLDLRPDSGAFIAWHVLASMALIAAATWGLGGTTLGSSPLNFLARHSPLGWTLAAILLTTGVAVLLGLAPMFGALVAGIVASNDTRPELTNAQQQVRAVGTSFFIPLYFALIGVSLDLVRDFDWRFSVVLLVVGTVFKYGGALMGAKLAGEGAAMAHAVAISVNARGGPGLVVASAAFAAGIVNPTAYSSLVLLAVATSVLAGIVLASLLRADTGACGILRGDSACRPGTPHSAPPAPAGAGDRNPG